MREKITYGFALFLLAAVWLTGCNDDRPIEEPTRVDDDPKVFIMYDNIGSWFNYDVQEAGMAVAEGALAQGHRVVVFHRKASGSQIYELVRDGSKKPASYKTVILKQYGAGEMNTLSPEVIGKVVGDIRSLVPANHYGLAFGSHGMGWIPKNYAGGFSRRRAEPGSFAQLWEIPENSLTRYLAYNTYEKIDVGEFADALDEWDWDFVLFDDCFMASVEALYEIRHLADYFIASPTEIMSDGFPYDRVVKVLFDDWTNLAGVGAAYVSAYRDGGIYPYATIAVVKSSELDALAESVRNIWNDIRSANPGAPDNNNVNPTAAGIQYYEGLRNHVFFDLDDYMRHFTSNMLLYSDFRNRLQNAVVFAGHTDRFFSIYNPYQQSHPINYYSGLSAFIPWSGTAALVSMYEDTEWYSKVYGE